MTSVPNNNDSDDDDLVQFLRELTALSDPLHMIECRSRPLSIRDRINGSSNALHWAVMTCDTEGVRSALANNECKQQVSRDTQTGITEGLLSTLAVMRGNVEIAKMLHECFDNDSSVNKFVDDKLVYQALLCGNMDMLTYVVEEHNADVSMVAEHYPLHLAIHIGLPIPILVFLVQHGADIMFNDDAEDDEDDENKQYERPAISHAMLIGNIPALKWILSLRSFQSYTNTQRLRSSCMMSSPLVVRTVLNSSEGNKQLMLSNGVMLKRAVIKNRITIVKVLIEEYNQDPNKCDIDDDTLLSIAAWHGHTSLVQYLAARQDVNINRLSSGHRTALARAVFKQRKQCVHTLLSLGAQVDIGCLLAAASTPNSEILNILLQHPSVTPDLINQVDTCPESRKHAPLHRAAGSGFHNQVLVLLHNGANVDAVDVNGCTPAMVALEHLDIVFSLMSYGADTTKADNHGNTLKDRIE